MKNKKKEDIKTLIIFSIIIGIFICYFSLHVAMIQHNDKTLNILSAMSPAQSHMAKHPFEIKLYSETASTVGTILFIYVMIMGALIIELERNIHDDSATINGSAGWITDLANYNKKYTDPPNSTSHNGYKNMILTNDIYLSMDGRQTMANNNILVVGGAGSGKSRFVIKPNVLQMNSSFIITDPSGELLESTGKVLEDNGYTIKVFNLTNMAKSNHYNPLHYIRDDLGVFMLVDCLITNTTPADQGKGDAFWVKSETALLEAIIFYLIKYEPKEIQNFSTVMEFLRMGTIKEGDQSGVNDLDKKFEELRSKNPNDIALKQYDAFKSGSTKTLQSIIISCQMRLASFNIQEIADLTNTDDIDLGSVADKRQALFIILPTAHSTFNYLASLMYSQLFETLYYHAEMECPNSYIVKTKTGQPIKFFKGLTEEQIHKALEVAKSKEFSTEEEINNIKNSDTPAKAAIKAKKYIDTVLSNVKIIPVEDDKNNYKVVDEDGNDLEHFNCRIKKDNKKNAYIDKKVNSVRKKYNLDYATYKEIDVNRYMIVTNDYDEKEHKGELLSYFTCEEQNTKKRKKILEEKLLEYKEATTSKVGLKLPIDIRFLLDEFANIGQIPDFVQKLSTMRKYLMSCTIILQSLSQIKTLYKDNWENIVSNCHFLYLGGNEETTLKYINEMLGKATVIKRNRSTSRGKGGGSLSYNLDSRELMTIDELARMPKDECILMITNERPYKGKKFKYESHPNYKYTADADVKNTYYIEMNKIIPNYNQKKNEYDIKIKEIEKETTRKREEQIKENKEKERNAMISTSSEIIKQCKKNSISTATENSVADIPETVSNSLFGMNASANEIQEKSYNKNKAFDKKRIEKLKQDKNKVLFSSSNISDELSPEFVESQLDKNINDIIDIKSYDPEDTTIVWEFIPKIKD